MPLCFIGCPSDEAAALETANGLGEAQHFLRVDLFTGVLTTKTQAQQV
jgi:hypothetical protein